MWQMSKLLYVEFCKKSVYELCITIFNIDEFTINWLFLVLHTIHIEFYY